MKKVLIGVLTLLLVTGCTIYKSKDITKIIELDNDKCKIEKFEDTHGGFLGDGTYFARMKCEGLNKDQLSSNWKEYPLTDEIISLRDFKMCEDDGCKSFVERYDVPDITNGYYIFIDRHSESKNKYDATDVNNRSSYNYSLAFYNLDDNKIYFYELDT